MHYSPGFALNGEPNWSFRLTFPAGYAYRHVQASAAGDNAMYDKLADRPRERASPNAAKLAADSASRGTESNGQNAHQRQSRTPAQQ